MDITIPAMKQLEAYNNRDIEAFMECYSKDCIVEDGKGNILIENKNQMRERYEDLFNSSPNLHCTLVSRTVVGSYVLDEENVVGSRGSSEKSHVIAVYRVSDGLIEHVRFLR